MKTHAFTSCATMCVQGSISELMLAGDAVYVFDPYSRGQAGEKVPYGTAVLLKFNSCEQYYSYLENMACT